MLYGLLHVPTVVLYSTESYVSYMKEVAAAAPDLPFYLYDIDFVTGITCRPNT